ncbi:hypothetical protein RJ639_000292 [Escallonia herrerae]|uniref:RING-type E3 ubiquitin transferase n=1 Tax=Escallonia herrerae TaxID=1293975 RepID=A0AA89BRX9_9ASTE|nr:hypothetical protein RJ639_000292 [Escallonia herrerae]
MIQNSDVFTRRILTFPAVRPSESVSPSTLLTSLIDIARTIYGYKKCSFVTNKRNARQVIRLTGNLLAFLEEIQNERSNITSSFVLSFSELHFVFQKVLYLLEDAARDDARVWMLMKSDWVSDQYRVLVRAIGVALDVLPLNSIDVSLEIKELVGFVMRQALKAKLEVDDKRALDKVVSILSGFEGGIGPELKDLKWVLEYLGIKNWSECNGCIKLLESEIGLEGLTDEKRAVGVLSSLVGFMSYCRSVVFDVVDRSIGRENGPSVCSSKVIRCLNSDDFRCPISLEIMSDPVAIATGHTYDRSSILKWFGAGNPTCPKTGEKLLCTDLVPNLALKGLIKQYCQENGVPVAESDGRNRNITRAAIASSEAAEEAMKMLANFLAGKLVAGTGKELYKAAFEIRLLTKTSVFNRSCLVEAGAIPNLLNLLSSVDLVTQENAVAALLNLSKHSKGKRVLVDNGGLELILEVVQRGLKMEARQHAAGVLFYLASVEEYRVMIGEIPEAIPALTELLVDGTDSGKKNALVAIFGLLMHPQNHWRVLVAGVVPLLVNLLATSEREDLITDSLAVLASLAEKLDGTVAILRAGAVDIFVGVLDSSTSKAAKEHCVSLLLALCTNCGADVSPVLLGNPSLMTLLYSLLTKGTSRASKRAGSLIRILHQFNEKRSSGLSSGLRNPALPREQIIGVW